MIKIFEIKKEMYVSVFSLLLANIIPIIGVIFFNWDLYNILILFWAESAIIGVYFLIRLAVMSGWASFIIVPFFAIHYGGFMFGHLVFLILLSTTNFFGLAGDSLVNSDIDGSIKTLDFLIESKLAIIALFFSHGISTWHNFFLKKEFVAKKDESKRSLMLDPYRRIVVMHLTIIFGTIAVLLLGSPVWALVTLVVLKIFSDLKAHLKEHTFEVKDKLNIENSPASTLVEVIKDKESS